MGVAEFRFHGSLNDFLRPRRRNVAVRHAIADRQSVKDAIEALGVPHPEVDLVTANGRVVDFGYRVRDGDRIAVYPASAPGSAGAGASGAGGPPAGSAVTSAVDHRFVVDGHLGRLAAYLRALGFDTWYRNHAADDELAERADADDRILLTRDRGLLKRSVVRRGYSVRSDRPAEQLAEVVDRFDLGRTAAPFGRCLRCNGVLETVEASTVADLVPPRVRHEQREFRRCPVCDRLYWKGSHHARMLRLVEQAVRHDGDATNGDAGERPGARPLPGARQATARRRPDSTS